MPSTNHLQIGSLIFPDLDQTDFTAPFEILSRIPDSTLHILWKDTNPLRDQKGLILTPETTLDDCPPLDVLHIPGGPGQQALMHDQQILSFIRRQAAHAKYLFSVCTGALILGAAGLLQGRRATTYWNAHHLLPWFGAIPVNQRVVVDGNLITTAGVTAGLDGALRLAALLRGDETAMRIQLYTQYAPEPPFHAGTPETAPPDIVASLRTAAAPLTTARLETARQIAQQLGVPIPPDSQ
jgi:cyclohexyl-isocyanide hydratase